MPPYLITDILQGLAYLVALSLIVVILRAAWMPPDQPERETTEEANRIVFSEFSEHGGEQEAEEIIERLLV